MSIVHAFISDRIVPNNCDCSIALFYVFKCHGTVQAVIQSCVLFFKLFNKLFLNYVKQIMNVYAME